MRYLRYSFYAVLMLGLILLALANRQVVTLSVLPEQLAGFFPVSVQLPLYIVILLAMLLGLLIGYIMEYFREYKMRREGALKKREAADLTRQVDELKKQTGTEDDDVLALLN